MTTDLTGSQQTTSPLVAEDSLSAKSPSSTVVESTELQNNISLNLQATATGLALLEMEGEEVFHAINMGREISLGIAITIMDYWKNKDKEDAKLNSEP